MGSMTWAASVFLVKSSSYFRFKTPASCQGWREKWFYVRNSSEEIRPAGFPIFSATQKATPKVSWEHSLSTEETAEVSDLMNKIEALRGKVDLDAFGLQVTATFVSRRIQPLQDRVRPMWEYSGILDLMRVSEEELTAKDLRAKLVTITALTKKEKFEASPKEKPFGEGKGPSEVCL